MRFSFTLSFEVKIACYKNKAVGLSLPARGWSWGRGMNERSVTAVALIEFDRPFKEIIKFVAGSLLRRFERRRDFFRLVSVRHPYFILACGFFRVEIVAVIDKNKIIGQSQLTP